MTKIERGDKIRFLDAIIKEHYNYRRIHTDDFIKKITDERNSLCREVGRLHV